MVFGVFLAIFNPSYFDDVFTAEDGFLEWMNVVALVTIASVTFRRAVVFASTQSKGFVAVNLLFTLIFLFGAGEEISWGQRIFGWESGEYFLRYNAQLETNFHNMTVNGVKINQPVFGTGFALILLTYLLVLAPLYHRRQGVRRFFDRLGVPMPKLYQALGYFVIAIDVELVVRGFSDVLRAGELNEFLSCFWVLLNVAFPANKILNEAAERGGGPADASGVGSASARSGQSK